MNKIKVVCENGSIERFENVVGHQIAGGCVQIVLNDGTQRIIAGFATVDVEPDEETKARSLALAEKAYKGEDNTEPDKVGSPVDETATS